MPPWSLSGRYLLEARPLRGTGLPPCLRGSAGAFAVDGKEQLPQMSEIAPISRIVPPGSLVPVVKNLRSERTKSPDPLTWASHMLSRMTSGRRDHGGRQTPDTHRGKRRTAGKATQLLPSFILTIVDAEEQGPSAPGARSCSGIMTTALARRCGTDEVLGG